MSREASYKVKIKKIENVDGSASMDILKKSVDKVIEQFNGEKSENILMDNKMEDCLFAIKFDNFPNGIGIDINEKGGIQTKYETIESNQGFPEKVISSLKQNYNRFAVEKALRKMGYETVTEEKGNLGEGRVIIIESKKKSVPSIKTKVYESSEKIKVDFFGFRGNECVDREKKLRDNLLEYGIKTEVDKYRDKSEEEMNFERGLFYKKIQDCPENVIVNKERVKIKS